MKILITNDDGIRAEGLEILARWARKIGEVTIAAPMVEQSGKSHSINIHSPFSANPVSYPVDGVRAWAVDSTPADCVRFYLATIEDADIVFSGINRGVNLGGDIAYSGTVGAVFEASYFGKKAVAFSTFPDSLKAAGSDLDRIWDYVTGNGLLEKHSLFNINIPSAPGAEIRITRQGGAYFKDRYEEISPGMYIARGYCVHDGGADMSLDTDALMSGCVSISPLSPARTDETVFRRLAGMEC